MRTLDIETLVLEKGAHKADSRFCVMEAVAFVAGEPWSDSPACCSPAIAEFLRSWNDTLNDGERQLLKPYVHRCVGTVATDAVEEQRSYLCVDWMIRVLAPAWLDLAELTEHASALRALPAQDSLDSLRSAQPVIDAADRAAYSAVYRAAYSAASSAAYRAVYRAASSAAYRAVSSAASSAAYSAVSRAVSRAASSAAYSAASRAAYRAASSAAYSAASRAAYSAASRAAYRAASSAAYSAASRAADEQLAATVVQLQQSAFDLLDRMIELSEVAQ